MGKSELHVNVVSRVQHTGWRYTFGILFNRVVPAWLFRYRQCVVFGLETCDSKPEPSVDRNPEPLDEAIREKLAVEVRWCQCESEIQSVERLTQFDRPKRGLGPEVCQAVCDGDLVGGLWAAVDWFEEPEFGIRFRIESDQVWLYSARVAMSHRRSGIYGAILQFVLADFKSQGRVHPLVAVNPANLRSLRSHRRFISGSLGRLFSLRLFQVTICFSTGFVVCHRWISFRSKVDPIEIRILTRR